LLNQNSINKETSTKALHKYIFYLITMLGVLLQLKQGASSLFDTDYPTVVILILALVVYGGSLIGATYINQDHLYLNLEKFMTKISLLFGAVSVVLELVILVPNLGLAALFFWIVWFVSFVGEYTCLYLETLYKSAIARIVQAFEKLKEYVARFTVRPDEQIGLP
ncbi:unnamed protein product, partial [Prunus brigantina]